MHRERERRWGDPRVKILQEMGGPTIKPWGPKGDVEALEGFEVLRLGPLPADNTAVCLRVSCVHLSPPPHAHLARGRVINRP